MYSLYCKQWIRIESRLCPVLILWLILTSVFVIKQSLQRPCWPLPSLMLVFPPAERLHHFQRPNLSLRRRGIALSNPLWGWGGPQIVTLWGLVRMCAIRLCFDPDRTGGCYTQTRKRVASHYLCSLDCSSLPVWAPLTDTFPFNFTWSLLTTPRLKTAEWQPKGKKLSLASLSRYLVFKPYYSSFIVSITIGQDQLPSVAHFVWDLQDGR